MTTTEERPSPTAGQRAAKAGAKHLGRKIGWILGAKIGFWVAAALILLLLVMAAGAQATTTPRAAAGSCQAAPGAPAASVVGAVRPVPITAVPAGLTGEQI